ncbi:MAG: efflux RND transporter periplasmic adaptor subunit [Prolixibacteraceae bacterium]
MKQLGCWLAVVTVVGIGSGCTSRNENIYIADADQAVKVKVQPIGISPESAERPYIGTIEEFQSVPLSYLISGTVEKVLANEGQCVENGQLLAVLNNESYKNAWQITLSKEKQAQDAYNRIEPVYKKGSLPEIKYIEIRTGLEQTRSMAAIAKKNLDDCNLYAPESGMIGKRMIEPGMSIVPGGPVFQLVKIEKVKVKIPVPESEIAGITKGQRAVLTVPALNNQKFEGEITEISVLSNPLSHTYAVKVELENQGKAMKPGMVCKVSLTRSTAEERIVVPASAVQVGGNGSRYVFVADAQNHKALIKPVVTGSFVSNGIMIKEGLSSGDLLIIEGYQKLNENSTILIIK